MSSTVDEIGHADENKCGSLVDLINSAGENNKFRYQWYIDDGQKKKFFTGTVMASWNSPVNQCLLFVKYDNKELYTLPFDSASGLVAFTEQKSDWEWLNDVPDWFTDAVAHNDNKHKAAQGLANLFSGGRFHVPESVIASVTENLIRTDREERERVNMSTDSVPYINKHNLQFKEEINVDGGLDNNFEIQNYWDRESSSFSRALDMAQQH